MIKCLFMSKKAAVCTDYPESVVTTSTQHGLFSMHFHILYPIIYIREIVCDTKLRLILNGVCGGGGGLKTLQMKCFMYDF